MPTDRGGLGADAALSVAIDATPLLGRPTGIGVSCAGSLSALAARRDLTVSAFAVSWRKRGPLHGLVPAGVSTTQRPVPARAAHWLWSRCDLPPAEWFLGRHDVVHGMNFVVPPVRHGAEVITVYDLTVLRFPELASPGTRAFPELVRRALRRGAWVHTLAASVAAEIVEVFAVPEERVRVVPPGIPLLPEQDRHPDEESGPSRRYVLAVGTVEPRKDYPTLLDAFDRLAGAREDLELVVVGEDGWGSEAFTASLEASPFADRVRRTGWVDDAGLARLLRSASVLAYPSLYEGFGFPPLQAMAAGVPVVATRAGAVPEVVGDGALVVEPGDADALAGALAQVLDDPVYARSLVLRGNARVAEFSWAATAEGLVGLYRDATS